MLTDESRPLLIYHWRNFENPEYFQLKIFEKIIYHIRLLNSLRHGRRVLRKNIKTPSGVRIQNIELSSITILDLQRKLTYKFSGNGRSKLNCNFWISDDTKQERGPSSEVVLSLNTKLWYAIWKFKKFHDTIRY